VVYGTGALPRFRWYLSSQLRIFSRHVCLDIPTAGSSPKKQLSAFLLPLLFQICLMAAVGVIGYRMDFYSVVYSAWLAGLFAIPRLKLEKVWRGFTIFVATMIALQYFIVVGAPPGLCIGKFPISRY